MAHKVLFVVSSHREVEGTDKKTGFDFMQLAKACNVLKKNNLQCELASIKGGKVCCEPESVNMEDPEVKHFWDTAGSMLENTRPLSSFNPDEYCAVYFVGGFGPMWDFPYDRSVNEFASKLFCNGGVIGATCKGPIVFCNIKDPSGERICVGKTITGSSNEEESNCDIINSYPECPKTHTKMLEDMMRASGANYCKGEPFSEHVVTDDRIVTGQNAMSAVGVANQMLEVLKKCGLCET